MEGNSMNITLHERDENGWYKVKTLPSDSPRWDDIDREWIDELFHCCTDVLTVGNIMYQLEH